MRVLVVDDHPNTATTLARALSQLGPQLEVISATSGRTALEQVQDGAVDLLITDMMMPDMNGLELIEKLQEHPAGRPAYTILITAYDVPGLKVSAQRLKVNETIIKPIRPELICQTVQKVMRDWGQSPAPVHAAELQPAFRILVADDIPDNVALLSRYLTSEGFSLITAADGEETLEKARAEMPDLVLLDVNMPKKDGFQVLREIRSDPALEHLPVIILTAARPGANDMQAGLNLGADDYVTKPFDRRELIARIRTKLRVKEAEDLIRRRNRMLGVLPEIGRELSARLDLHELAGVVLRRTVETLGARCGRIVIYDPDGPIEKCHQPADPAGPGPALPLEAFLEDLRETRQALIVADTREEPRWPAADGDPSRSAILVPLSGRRELIGLLALTHEEPGYFSADHRVLLQAIASQAVIAIENAQLFSGIARERQRLEAVLQGAAEAILMFDGAGNLAMLNRAAEGLFSDYPARLGRTLDRGNGYDALVELQERARASGEAGSGELAWPDQRTFAAVATPIQDGGCVVMLHDVTRFKDFERVKNEFISTVSHDLKSPIGVIVGFSHLIPKVGPLNAEQAGFVEQIQAASSNMNELVQNLLQLAKMDMGAEPLNEVVDMNDLLADIATEFEPQLRGRTQSFRLHVPGRPLPVRGSPIQLKQALRNLMGNAVKYTPPGGSIDLSATEQAGRAVVYVRDTGCGIPAPDLPFVFDRFYRVRDESTRGIEGNGLGLAIVKSIVEKHGGEAGAESEVGRGTCMRMSLPLVPPAAGRTAVRRRAAAAEMDRREKEEA